MFTAIAKSGCCDLHVVFLKGGVGYHPWRDCGAMNFKHSICAHAYDLLELASVRKHSNTSGVVVGGWTGTRALLLCRLVAAKLPFAVWADMPILQRKRPMVKRVIREAWVSLVFSRARVVMGTGTGALNALEEMGCPRTKLFNFPYFVDTDYFFPSPMDRSDEPLRILSIGRLAKSKAHDIAISAITNLLRSNHDLPEFEYTIVGDGPERAALQSLANRVPSRCKVSILGWLEQGEILSLLQDADLLLHPSYEEPYGVSVLEAMAVGVPTVVSDVCGVAIDRIENGINGLVHKTGDVSDLTRQISIGIRNTALRRSMGRAARRTAEVWSLGRSVDLVSQLVGKLT